MPYPINVHGNQLKKDESHQLNSFLLLAARLINQRKITFLYRGDSISNICSRLNVPYPLDKGNRRMFYERLFMLGEKAKHFYSERINGVHRQGTPINIEDTSENAFSKIFDNINTSTRSKNSNAIAFFNRNRNLKDYFSDKKNKVSFICSSQTLDSDQAKASRNYYYTLLHQLGAINYKNKSHLISTSINYQVASQFAGDNNGRVIIHAWTPSSKLIKGFIDDRLPTYSGRPYEWQREHSAIAGILPHYILGLEILDKQQLIINPNLFFTPITESVFSEGLEIDQSKFDSILVNSNYSHGYIDLDGKLYEI